MGEAGRAVELGVGLLWRLGAESGFFSDEATYGAVPAASLVAESVLWPHGPRRWGHFWLHGLSS